MTNTPDLPVFYASTEGQTRAIAERLAAVLRDEGVDSRAIELGGPDAAHVDWPRVRGALVGASLHMGTHQRGVAEFVRAHADRLNALPTAFFSVSLSAASANAAERAEARRMRRRSRRRRGGTRAMSQAWLGAWLTPSTGF